MVFDISFMAGIDVEKAVLINQATSGSSQQNLIVVRAARAVKMGARAGRISRVLKILRFLWWFSKADDSKKVKMARVISSQLTNAVSTRVAFLTICVVVVMPLLTLFVYPEFDNSMGAWVELLSLDAQAFYEAHVSGNATAAAAAQQFLLSEASRFSAFYSDISYGPFEIEYGESRADHSFVPRPDILNFSSVNLSFNRPRRSSSARVVSQGRVQASFDLSAPNQVEAAANIGLICFIMLAMVIFGMVMSSSIGVIALKPLERMLSVVRERCQEIFKFTLEIKDDDSESDEEEEDYDDMEHGSEFMLLEKVVGRLTVIAQLSASPQEPEVNDHMEERDIVVLNWMQGAQVPTTTGEGRQSFMSRGGYSNADFFGPGSKDAPAPGHGRAFSAVIPPGVVEKLDLETFCPLDLARSSSGAS